MRRYIAVTSIVLFSMAAPALAQSNMGMDASGRFDGTPPLGTSAEYDAQQSGLSIPLDPVQTGSVTVTRPSEWDVCGAPANGMAATGDGSVNAACPDRNN
jgi:hypothetical protein